MKILDRYIIKKFLGTFLYTLTLIILVAIVFDIQEKLDDFIEKNAPIKAIIFDYYLNFAPYYANLFMFLFIFISVIFFTSKMASRCEFIAILTSGVSFKRLMLPYFLSALVLGIFSFLLSSFVIPPANKVRLNFENTYINGTFYNDARNIHRQIEPGKYIYMEGYNASVNTGYRFSIEKFENKKLVSKLISDYVIWDTTKHKWSIHNYYIRNIKDNKETISKGSQLDTLLNITPEDFEQRGTMVETLNLFQLNKYIDKQKLRGDSSIDLAYIEKYRRFAFPFSAFILTLIGVSIASRKTRGGTGLHLGIGLLLSFTYILFMQISAQFAINSSVAPLVAVWIPNFIFSIVAGVLYFFAPK